MSLRLAFALFLLVAGAARADEVILHNGDRLTGTVVRKEGDELVFKTDYAGEIKIAWGKVARLDSEQPMALVLSDQSLAEAHAIGAAPKPPAPAAQEGAATPGATNDPSASSPADVPPAREAPAPVPIDSVAYINAGPGLDVLGVRWKGRLNVGGSGNRGNSRTDSLHIEGEAVARQQRNRWTLSGVFDRGSDRDVETRHNGRASGKYDLFINPRWYGYGMLTLEEDRFRDIDQRTTLGAGIGHQLIDSERTSLSLEGGLNYVSTNFDMAQDEHYPAARWALKYDQRLFGTELELFHNHELLADLNELRRTFVRSQTGLRMPLLKRLMATAQLNVDFDNAPADGKEKSDRVYLFTVGYRW